MFATVRLCSSSFDGIKDPQAEMDLHQLKTFVVVAREGSITRASEQLHLSQPAVFAHLASRAQDPFVTAIASIVRAGLH